MVGRVTARGGGPKRLGSRRQKARRSRIAWLPPRSRCSLPRSCSCSRSSRPHLHLSIAAMPDISQTPNSPSPAMTPAYPSPVTPSTSSSAKSAALAPTGHSADVHSNPLATLQQTVNEIPTQSYHDDDPADALVATDHAKDTPDLPLHSSSSSSPRIPAVGFFGSRSASSTPAARTWPTTPPVAIPSASPSFSVRRPSSSLSIARSLTPSDSSYPQRLPRQPTAAETAHLTELHQELEAEQEAAVNRLLHQIRMQQLQAAAETDSFSTAATVGSTGTRGHGRSSQSQLSSHTSSPVFVPVQPGDSFSEANSMAGSGTHSEVGFNLAETHMLKRENEMLKRWVAVNARQALLTVTDASASWSGRWPISHPRARPPRRRRRRASLMVGRTRRQDSHARGQNARHRRAGAALSRLLTAGRLAHYGLGCLRSVWACSLLSLLSLGLCMLVRAVDICMRTGQ